MVNLPSNIFSVSAFGSFSRGDCDELSDFDILVLVRDGGGTVSEDVIVKKIAPLCPKPPSISFYGENKIKRMFAEGHLFAWHLYMESAGLLSYPSPRALYGKPHPYQTMSQDVEGLINILLGVKKKIDRYPQNSVFEMGIIYVCLRNIAMSASEALSGKHRFGRYSPYEILSFQLPISKADYEKLMLCRMASTRGITPPSIDAGDVASTLTTTIPWARRIAERIGVRT